MNARSPEHRLALKVYDSIQAEHRETLSTIEDAYAKKGIPDEIINFVVAVSSFNRDLMLDFAARYAEALRGESGTT